MFYFSSFDESWKTGDRRRRWRGDVGAHWGLWDNRGRLQVLSCGMSDFLPRAINVPSVIRVFAMVKVPMPRCSARTK